MFSNRNFVCLLALSVIGLSFTGCRNRCMQPYGNPYQQQFQQPYQQYQQPFPNQMGYNGAANYGQANGVAGRSPVIPPPATNSLNIPSLARNNPFGANRGLLNTGQRAPTPASNRSARFNQQNGWQPVGTGTNNGAGNTRTTPPQPNNTQPSGGTTLGSNSRTASPTAPASARSVLVADTQSRPAGYGDSFIRSPNYSTTAVNETNDRTRLPATDASGVRAPSQYYARASGVQVANLPRQGTFGAPQQPYYSGTFRGNNPAAFNVAPGMLQTGGRPVGAMGVFAANSGAFVQGQSTATYDPYGNTRSADWRNRDISSGTFQ